MSTTKRALMNPTPTLALARKWVSSTTSIDSTPGPHDPTWFGSMTNAQTRSRGALMSTVPENCIESLSSGAYVRWVEPAPTYAVGSFMNRDRQPTLQNA